MYGIDDGSFRAASEGARRRGSRSALIAAAVLAAFGLAGCSANGSSAASTASTSAAGSQAPSATARPAAPVALSWNAQRAPLPPDAQGVSGQYVMLEDVSCPAAGYCVAVGSDDAQAATGEVVQGLVETLSDGTWTATAVPGVSTPGQDRSASLTAISCPDRDSCVVVGFIASQGGVFKPVIATLSGGHWDPVKAPLPGDWLTTGAATLDDVTCPSAGTCVATGWYINRDNDRVGYVDTLAGGTWTATAAPLPANAAPEQASSPASTFLAAVSCTGADSCVATGEYLDAFRRTEALIDTLAGGTWTATAASLPANAAASGQVAGLWAIGCSAPGSCVAAGHYIERGGQPRFLAGTLSNGTWTPTSPALPHDAAGDQKWSKYQATTVGGLGCAPDGPCVATAGYVTRGGATAPLLQTVSGKTWTTSKAPLPADAIAGTQQNSPVLFLPTCQAAGHCVAVGSYPAADGTMEGLIETATPA
ncbi:MAG: hypothetical protein ACRDNS_04950 [Trebonia sp.]